MKYRDLRIDTLKGFAIILVVIGHVIQYTNGEVYDQNFLFKWIYSFHMPLFIFLAGMSMCYSLNKTYTTRMYVRSQFMRIMVPFLAWTIINATVRTRMSGGGGILDNFVGILMHPEKGLWFLWALFFIKVSFFFTIKAKVSLYCLLLSICFLYLVKAPDLFGLQNILKYYPYFVLGYMSIHNNVILKYIQRAGIKYELFAFLTALIASAILLSCRYNTPFGIFVNNTASMLCIIANKIMLFIIALVFILFWLTLSSKHQFLHSKLLQYLGTKSLDIYVLSVLGNMVISRISWLQYACIDNWLIYIIEVAFLCIIVMLGSILLSYVINKSRYASILLLGKKCKNYAS